MKDSQLVSILKTMDHQQWVLLDKFIRSPFYNPDAEKDISPTHTLFCFLKPFCENLEVDSLDKSHAHQFIFPNEEQVKGRIEKLMSRLLKLVKEFIVVQRSEIDNEIIHSLKLASCYSEHSLDERFYSEIKKLRKYQSEVFYKNETYFWNQFKIDKLIYEFESKKNIRKGDINLNQLLLNLNYFFLITKLKYATQLLQQKNFVTLSNEKELIELEKLLSEIELEEEENPMVLLFAKAIPLIKNNPDYTKEDFEKYQKLLNKLDTHIKDEDLNTLQSYLRNFCTFRYNNGEDHYLKVIFEIYQKQIEKKTIYSNGLIQHSTFTNIVVAGLKLKRYDWIKSFLLSHKDLIGETDYPEEVFNLNFANYYFHIKEYDEAWKLLDGTYKDMYYNLTARRLEIKILYETEEYDLLDSFINKFKVLVTRLSNNRIHLTIKKLNHTFANILLRILNPKTKFELKRVLKIRQDIIDSKSVAEREWLLEKIEELRRDLEK